MIKRIFSLFAPVGLAIAAVFNGSSAWAITTPATGTFLYPLYDIAVNKMANGAVMFTIAVAGIIIGGVYMFHSEWGKSAGAFIATGVIVAAPSIVPTLGMTF